MMNGYVSVDCKKLNLLSETKVTVPGIFKACKAAIATGKPIFAVNCAYGTGVPVTPIQVFAIEQGGRYCLSASIIQVWVDSEDGCTMVGLIPG